MRSAYAQAAASVSGNDMGSYGLCCAAGCVQFGSMSTSTTGTSSWYCSDHFRAPSKPKPDPLAAVDGSTSWIDGVPGGAA